MSLLLDSEAQFSSRALEVGLTTGVIGDLKAAGVGTLSQLAFVVGQPGQPILAADVDRILHAALCRAPTLAENAAVRRLGFEAQTLVVANLRQIVEQRDDGAPKKIGAAERETRMATIRAELGGLSISEENEPSHILLDKAVQIYETNTVKYLEPSVCTSRSQEVQGGTKSKELSFEGGALIIRDKDDKLIAPTSSELHFLQAMTRRGIAMKFARLMTYEQRNQWVSFLIQSMQREPPPGYNKPSLHQLMLCDRAAFTRLATTMTQVRPLADGSFPLGVQLLALRSDPMIALHLAPLGKQTQPASSTGQDNAYAPQRNANRFQQQHNEKKGKGKGKKGKSPPIPMGLRGKWHRAASGEPLCFAYNLGGCDLAGDGMKCPKGWHLCAEPKCLMDHPLPKHPSGAAPKRSS